MTMMTGQMVVLVVAPEGATGEMLSDRHQSGGQAGGMDALFFPGPLSPERVNDGLRNGLTLTPCQFSSQMVCFWMLDA
jgi:hypothetical protein